jgi:DDE superfamily endonuclease
MVLIRGFAVLSGVLPRLQAATATPSVPVQGKSAAAVAVAFSMAWPENAVQGGSGEDRARGMLAGFRVGLYQCLGKRRDALSGLADAVLRKQDRVHMLAELSLEPECRRGHGAVYDAVNAGQVRIARLAWALAALPLPRWDDGRIRLAADVSNWLRPDAATCPDRLFCHCYARGKGNAQMIPGWPYSVVAALEPGRTSWTLPLDAVRLGPADDATESLPRSCASSAAIFASWKRPSPAGRPGSRPGCS